MEYLYWFIGIFAALIIVFIFDYYFYHIKTFKTTNKLIISRIAHCGLLVAVAVLIQFITSSIFFSRYLQFPFTNIPLAFCGFLFGPFFGFVSGLVYDGLQTLFGIIKGSFHPAFTFINGCLGLIPGLMVVLTLRFNKFFLKYGFLLIWTLIILMLIGSIIYSFFNVDQLAKRIHLSKTGFLIVYYLLMLIFCLSIFLLYLYNFKKKKIKNVILFHFVFLTFFIEMIVVSFFLTPVILNQMYKIPISISVLVRMVLSPLTFGVVSLITLFIVYRLKNIITSDKSLYYVINLDSYYKSLSPEFLNTHFQLKK